MAGGLDENVNIQFDEGSSINYIDIPVIITESGISDVVYNDFYIGKNSNVVIVAGCGIHNDHGHDSQHDGIHRFFLEEGAKVKYIEKHYGEGKGAGKRILGVRFYSHTKHAYNYFAATKVHIQENQCPKIIIILNQ